jgi:hypothetical protein
MVCSCRELPINPKSFTPGWVTSKDEGAQSKCEPGASGQCQDLGRLADHASSAVGSAEDDTLRLALIKLNSAARYRQDCRRQWSKKTCAGSRHEVESFGCKLLGVAVTVAGVLANALVDNGCGGELLISRAFASRVGIDYVNSEWEIVELPDKTLLPVTRTQELDLVVGPIRDRICAVVTELVAFDVILGLPWLRRWNPVVDWRGEKLLANVGGHVMNASLDPTADRQSDVKTTFVSAVHVKKKNRKDSDWFMVHVNAVKADVQTGLSTNNDKEKLNHEWRALIEKYGDAFPEEHPGMPPRRNVELKIELKEGAEPVSNPVYRLCPAERATEYL